MQVCLVTGGNSGVGLMTAIGLAKLGNHVFIACRSANKAAKAIDYIRQTTGNENVKFLPLDLYQFNMKLHISVYFRRAVLVWPLVTHERPHSDL